VLHDRTAKYWQNRGTNMNAQKNSHPDLIDSLLADCKRPQDLVGENGLLKQLAQSMTERALQVEREQAAILPIRKCDHD